MPMGELSLNLCDWEIVKFFSVTEIPHMPVFKLTRSALTILLLEITQWYI